MTISYFLRGLTIGSIIMTAATGMERQSSSLKFRAQDDETLGGLKLMLTIPTPIKDGPEDDHIKIMVEDSEKAVKDSKGNFLEYKVNQEGKIAPNVSLLSLTSPTRKWPPTGATVLIEPRSQKKQEQLEVLKKNSVPYYVGYKGFFYDLPDDSPNSPYPLEPLDKYGKKLPIQPVERMPFFDKVSIFGAVWYVLDMYTKDINELGNSSLRSKWNRRGVIQIYPDMNEEQYNFLFNQRPGENPGEDYEDYLGNAFYVPIGDAHYMCFFPFSKGGSKTTGQSTDIVMHETGHYVLHILRSDLREKSSALYDIAAFDESFGDLTTFFALASIEKIAERIINLTHGNLETSSFFSVIGETLSKRRDAASKTDLSQRPSCEEHAYSERLTKAIYGTLADGFNFLKRVKFSPSSSETTGLTSTARTLRKLFLESVINIPAEDFNFANLGRHLEKLAQRNMETSFFTGYIYHNFAKQGIDLNNMIWAPICILDAEAEAKSKLIGTKGINWVCSSSLDPHKETVGSFRNLSITQAPLSILSNKLSTDKTTTSRRSSSGNRYPSGNYYH